MTEVTLRGLEVSDWQDIAEIYISPKCLFFASQLPYQSRQDFQQRTEKIVREGYGLVAVVGGKVIGIVNLTLFQGSRSHVGKISIAVRDDYQNQGIGSQLLEAIIDVAEKWLNLQRLELGVYCNNNPAIALYKKYGFEIEGTLKKSDFRDGVYIDAYFMARIRDE
ncbi:GNAT family N-acetyltransferase [Coleofasciculus chthonoplastes]|uniref:GNAT family N-acetyltransferase n=1 Tax=Coleofasciculus chthonoplastes TaxID=64178 RepID=UPI0032FEAA43